MLPLARVARVQGGTVGWGPEASKIPCDSAELISPPLRSRIYAGRLVVTARDFSLHTSRANVRTNAGASPSDYSLATINNTACARPGRARLPSGPTSPKSPPCPAFISRSGSTECRCARRDPYRYRSHVKFVHLVKFLLLRRGSD